MKLTADSIGEVPQQNDLSKYVEQVTVKIKEYNRKSDLTVLEKLKDLCIKENMTIEMAKMYRNIGMYQFYANDFSNAIIAMQLAVDLLRREDCIFLLTEFYSELGFIYFFSREYLYSKRYYEETEELLLQAPDVSRHIKYLHYYRYGILLSNMQEYALSRLKLEKALMFAEDEKDTALIIMNIGLLSKRQKDMKTALRYYSKALFLLGKKENKTKSIIYNNIAEVYKILGQYKKALGYIDKAFKCITDNDLSRLFVYFNTFTEIKVLMGEREAVLDEFLVLLVRVKDYHLYRGLIIEGISNMIVIGCEDRKLLKRLETAIIKLIGGNAYGNEEFIKELKVCLGNIRLCLKELNNNVKGGV